MISDLFVATAQAAEATAGQEPSFLASIMPFALIMVVFYFLLIRPQQKKMKDHQELVSGTQVGDKVVTSGGIIGVVKKVSEDNTFFVEIAKSVEIEVKKEHISETQAREKKLPAIKEKAKKKAVAKKAPASKDKKETKKK